MNGTVTGSLCIGLLSNPVINGVYLGLRQFLIQLLGSVLVGIYSIVLTYAIFWICDKTASIKVSPEVQKSGLDYEFFEEHFSDLKYK